MKLLLFIFRWFYVGNAPKHFTFAMRDASPAPVSPPHGRGRNALAPARPKQAAKTVALIAHSCAAKGQAVRFLLHAHAHPWTPTGTSDPLGVRSYCFQVHGSIRTFEYFFYIFSSLALHTCRFKRSRPRRLALSVVCGASIIIDVPAPSGTAREPRLAFP